MSSDETISELLAGLQECDDPGAFLAKAKKAHPELAEDLDRHAALLELLDDVVQKEAEGVPPQIGPYRIIDFLARGGMGSVYLAEQEKPLRRRVALKILSSHVDRPEARARFDVERSVLSRMDHPNIARVFDAGPLPDGRPYVVMEYVDGPPLTEYCEQQGLNLEARLELFVDVCEAVALRPSEGRDPSRHQAVQHSGHRGRRPTDPEGDRLRGGQSDRPARSGADPVHPAGRAIGTPEYMSPEQMEAGGREVDTRTDVYALGLTLYELLVGVLPLDRARLRQMSLEQIRDCIRAEELPRPSERVGNLLEGSAGANRRRADPAALRRELRGDLDWIVMTALEKDPARRYGSPNELADDIERYLPHQPVTAGPPTTGYRLGKFVRRHVAAVAAAAGIALALLGGLVVSQGHYREAERAWQDAEAHAALERDARLTAEAAETAAGRALREKEAEARKAWVARDFLREMFAEVRPSYHGADARLLDVLTPAGERLATALPDDPEIQATLHAILGSTHLQLGAVDKALPHLDQAVALRTRALGDQHPDTTEVRIRHAVALTQGDRLAEAADALRVARVALEDLDDAPLELSAALLEAEADLALSAGKNEEAAMLYRQALAVTEQRFPGASMRTLPARHGLARALQGQGDTEGAAAHLKELVALAPEFLQEDDPRLYAIQLDWVRSLNRRGSHREAAQLANGVLRGVQRHAGPAHPHALGTLEELARALRGQGVAEAAETLEARLDSLRQTGSGTPESPATNTDDVARLREDAEALREQGDLAGALEIHDAARGLLAADLGGNDDEAVREALIDQLNSMAALAHALQDHARTVGLREVAVQHQRMLTGAHPTVEAHRRALGNSLVNVAIALRAAGRPDEALTRVREGRRLLAALVRDEPRKFEPRFLLAHATETEAAIQTDRGAFETCLALTLEAATQFETLVSVDERPGRSHAAAAKAYSNASSLLSQLGRTEEQRERLTDAVRHYREVPAEDPDPHGQRAIEFAETLLRLAYFEEHVRFAVGGSGSLRREAIAMLESVRDRTTHRAHWRRVMGKARTALADQLLEEGDFAGSRDVYAKALAEWESVEALADDHAHTSHGADYHAGLGMALWRLAEHEKAREHFRACIGLMQRLIDGNHDPLTNARRIAQSWTFIGDSLAIPKTHVAKVADSRAALAAYDRAVSTVEGIHEETPQARGDLVHPLTHRARAQLALGNSAEAIRDLEAATTHGRAALARVPGNRRLQQHLSVAWSILSRVHEASGEGDEALRVLSEQVRMLEDLARSCPDHRDLLDGVLTLRRDVLLLLGRLGRAEEAGSTFEESLDAWGEAWQRWKGVSQVRSMLAQRLYGLAMAAAPLGAPLERATQLAIEAARASAEHVAGDSDDTASVFALLDGIAAATFCTLRTQEPETTIRWAKRGLEVLSPLLEASSDDLGLLERAWILESKVSQAASHEGSYPEADQRARASPHSPAPCPQAPPVAQAPEGNQRLRARAGGLSSQFEHFPRPCGQPRSSLRGSA